MNRRTELPQSLRNRAFSVAEARDLGIGRDRLRARDLLALHHGLRAPASAIETAVDAARALLPALRVDQYFSHSTAAEIWSVPLPREFHRHRDLHVTTPQSHHAMRRPGVAGHVSRTARAVTHLGLPVSTPAATWVELASQVDVEALVVAGDALVGRQLQRSSVEELRTAAVSVSQPRSRSRARRALDLIRVGAESPKETQTRLLLPQSLQRIVDLNVRVFGGGRHIGRPDLLFTDAMVVVEYEGDHHRSDRSVFRRDIERREEFAQHGWRVVQVSQQQLDRPAQMCSRLEDLVRSRAGSGAPLTFEYRDSYLWAVHG